MIHCCKSLKSTILNTPFSLNCSQNISFPACMPFNTVLVSLKTESTISPQNSYSSFKAYLSVHSFIQEKSVACLHAKYMSMKPFPIPQARRGIRGLVLRPRAGFISSFLISWTPFEAGTTVLRSSHLSGWTAQHPEHSWAIEGKKKRKYTLS